MSTRLLAKSDSWKQSDLYRFPSATMELIDGLANALRAAHSEVEELRRELVPKELRELSEAGTQGWWEWHSELGNFITDEKRNIVAEIPCQAGNPADGALIVTAVNHFRALAAKS